MKILFKRTGALLLALLIISLSACTGGVNSSKSNDTLKVGVDGLGESFNPFYPSDSDDPLVMSQIFEQIRRPSSGDRLVNVCGSITYEYPENGQIKITVSIDDSVRYSDGSTAKIDDVIFYYYVLADATYDGRYSYWRDIDIAGLKEYYYDDPNYAENIKALKPEEGETQADALDRYIKDNYADGVDVGTISGIKKISGNSCTILLNSMDINTISALNPVLIPRNVYGVGYIKGAAETIKNADIDPVGTGPFALKSFDEKTGKARLVANEYYHEGTAGFKTLEFYDISSSSDKASLVINGEVDVAELPAVQSTADSVTSAGLRYTICDERCYYSMLLNCASLDIGVRQGIIKAVNWDGEVKSRIGNMYTPLYRTLNAGFEEYPSDVTEGYYKTGVREAQLSFAQAGYNLSQASEGKVLTSSDGIPLKIKAVCLCEEGDSLYYAAESCVSSLVIAGVEAEAEYTDAEGFAASLAAGDADIWIGPVYNGYSCDLSGRFGSSGAENYCGISDEALDVRLDTIKKTMDINSRKDLTAECLDYIMSIAVEYPMFQQKRMTVFNTKVIDNDSVSYESDPQGCRYLLYKLEPVR